MVWSGIDANAASNFMLALLLLVCAGYLWTLRPRSWLTQFLSVFFLFTCLFTITLGLDGAVQHTPAQVIARAASMLFVAGLLACLLQFVYNLPEPLPAQHRETRLVWLLSVIAAAGAVVLSGIDLANLIRGEISFHSQKFLWIAGIEGTWAVITCFRRSARFIKLNGHAPAPAGTSSGNWAARTCRDFGLLLIPGLVFFALLALVNNLTLAPWAASLAQLFNHLFAIIWVLLFTNLYLNTFPVQSSILAKITGGTLLFFLSALVILNHVAEFSVEKAYVDAGPVRAGTAIHFTPLPASGMHVNSEALPALAGGKTLQFAGAFRKMELPFEFPFFGKTWQTVYIHPQGVITFDGPYDETQFRAGFQPGIAPFLANLSGGTLSYSQEPGHITFTWQDMTLAGQADSPNTFQVDLARDGSFTLRYYAVTAAQNYDREDPMAALALTGAMSGQPGQAIDHMPINAFSLPFTSMAQGGVVDDHYADFREYVQGIMLTFLWVGLLAAALILVGVPWFFARALVRPLNNLQKGLREVAAGQLGASVAVSVHDEIGRLTENFNDMSHTLNTVTGALSSYQEQVEDLELIATTDELTGLYNRRRFNIMAAHELVQAYRINRPISVLMIDIDFFKAVNDTYGHMAGDEVLQGLAVVLLRSLRGGDLLARFGGEEFVILLPNAGPEPAHLIAERLRRIVADNPIHTRQQDISITVSIGTASRPETSTSIQAMIERADKALYAAKRNGRNRVEVASEEGS